MASERKLAKRARKATLEAIEAAANAATGYPTGKEAAYNVEKLSRAYASLACWKQAIR